MSNPTSNFGWQMPTATDLVTDLPADFEVFGQAVDTDFVDLLGGTTGQILSKTSGTDLDFTWITNDVGDITAVTAGTGISGGGTSGAVTVTNSMATEIAAKADLIVGTGAATFDNLTVGANGTVLTADSTVSPTGLKWATPASGGSMTLLSTTSLSGASTTVSSISQSYQDLYITVQGQTANAHDIYNFAPNNTANFAGSRINTLSNAATPVWSVQNAVKLVTNSAYNANSTANQFVLKIYNYALTTNYKVLTATDGFITSDPFNATTFWNGALMSTSAISSFTVSISSGVMQAGTIKVYGVN
jgi:hypothetical protein